jgi:hypothetical protein
VAIFPFPSGAYVERNTLKGNFMIIYGGIAWDFNRGTSAPKAGALPLGDAPKESMFYDYFKHYQQ